jgi:hypothetical protein
VTHIRHALLVVAMVLVLAAMFAVFFRPGKVLAATSNTMAGQSWLTSRTAEAQLGGHGTYRWVICGVRQPGNEQPCLKPDVPCYASYLAFRSAVGALRGRTVMLDLEGWNLTPRTEQQHERYFLKLAGLLARARGITLIEAAVPTTGSTPRQRRNAAISLLAYEARWAAVVDIQDQSATGNPAAYVAEARTVTRAVRKVNPHVVVMDNLGTDSGGWLPAGPHTSAAANAQVMYRTWLAARRYIGAWWLELPQWPGVCQPAGCPQTAALFLTRLGAS